MKMRSTKLPVRPKRAPIRRTSNCEARIFGHWFPAEFQSDDGYYAILRIKAPRTAMERFLTLEAMVPVHLTAQQKVFVLRHFTTDLQTHVGMMKLFGVFESDAKAFEILVERTAHHG